MANRTKTYIAGDWTGDKDAIDQLYRWKNNQNLILDFIDAHELTQSRDSSLSCTIKASLRTRLDASKTFVLIVGNGTKNLRSGGCQYCGSYNSHTYSCARGYSVDYKSYVDYECDKAIRDGLKIVVLYNAASVDKSKCPDIIKNAGRHIPMKHWDGWGYSYDYQAVKDALM